MIENDHNDELIHQSNIRKRVYGNVSCVIWPSDYDFISSYHSLQDSIISIRKQQWQNQYFDATTIIL